MATCLGLWQSRMAPGRPVRVPSSEESGAPGAAPGAVVSLGLVVCLLAHQTEGNKAQPRCLA
jgi:hypothetical protein